MAGTGGTNLLATDLLDGNPISKGNPTGPQATLDEFWQLDAPRIGGECSYKWRVRLAGNQEYARLKHVTVAVEFRSQYVSIFNATPEDRQKLRGKISVKAGANVGVASVGVDYSTPVEIQDIRMRLVKKNLVQWTFLGKLDEVHTLMLEGVVVLRIDGNMPNAEPIRVFFTAAPTFEKNRRFGRDPTSEAKIDQEEITSLSPGGQPQPTSRTGSPTTPLDLEKMRDELDNLEWLLTNAENEGEEDEYRKKIKGLRTLMAQASEKARQQVGVSMDVERPIRVRVPTPRHHPQRPPSSNGG